MNDPYQIAEKILGPIIWKDEVTGFCKCPGESSHTTQDGEKHCRVKLDGVPTVYCVHSSCADAVSEANKQLRREFRKGGILQPSGNVEPHVTQEKQLLDSLRAKAEQFKPELFRTFHWPLAQIIQDSPTQIPRSAEDQFLMWLRIWPANSTVWMGDVSSSGKPEHSIHFKSVTDWQQFGHSLGNYTCGASFKPGSFSRSNDNVERCQFLVVESDILSKDEVGAIFAYMNKRLNINLHTIIDTAGKSLHGWFDAPQDKQKETQLKTMLTVFGCDPKLFTYSQPVRVPGAYRDGKLQQLIWLRETDF